jgi:hypothetical protein
MKTEIVTMLIVLAVVTLVLTGCCLPDAPGPIGIPGI